MEAGRARIELLDRGAGAGVGSARHRLTSSGFDALPAAGGTTGGSAAPQAQGWASAPSTRMRGLTGFPGPTGAG